MFFCKPRLSINGDPTQLRLELQTCTSELRDVREWWLEKKRKCGKLEEQVTELQAEVGKWKYMVESGARLANPRHDDVQRRVSRSQEMISNLLPLHCIDTGTRNGEQGVADAYACCTCTPRLQH